MVRCCVRRGCHRSEMSIEGLQTLAGFRNLIACLPVLSAELRRRFGAFHPTTQADGLIGMLIGIRDNGKTLTLCRIAKMTEMIIGRSRLHAWPCECLTIALGVPER